MDVLLAFPGILLNLAIVAVVKRPGVGVMVFAIALNGWVGYTRVARGQVFLPMHDAATNRLTLPVYDPYSRQPGYKYCAVRVERVA